MNEITTELRFNLATLYESQQTGDHFVEEYHPLNNDFRNCDYYEPHNLESHLINSDMLHDKCLRSFIHLNCRGLASNWDKFYDLLCDIHSNEFSFDFIGISEVFRCDFDQCISPPGYHNISTRCRDLTDDSRGGVALFIK